MTIKDKLTKLIDHINLVRMNCEKLGWKLIEIGDHTTGVELIARGFRHDASKFKDQEWDLLWPDVPLEQFKIAHKLHVLNNDHHPEYWHGISNMSKAALAEMVCDWLARSQEQGTNIREWLHNDATIRFNFDVEDQIGSQLVVFLNLLLEQKFSKMV